MTQIGFLSGRYCGLGLGTRSDRRFFYPSCDFPLDGIGREDKLPAASSAMFAGPAVRPFN